MKFTPAKQTNPVPSQSLPSQPFPSQALPSESAEASSSDDVSHILAASWGDEPAAPVEGEAVEGGLGEDAPRAARISKDAFFASFRFLFTAPNFLIAPPLASLEIPQDDQEARAASDALFDTCCDVPWLNFLVSPSSVWAERAMVIGMFTFGKAAAVRAELAERKKNSRREPVAGLPEPAGAGEDAPAPPSRPSRDMEILNPTKEQEAAA